MGVVRARALSAARSGLPAAMVGRASSATTCSGHLNLVTPRAANQARHSARSNGADVDDEGDDPLAQAVVGPADGHGLAHGGMGLEHRLDLGGGDVLAAADDHVLDAAHDGEPAVVDRSPGRRCGTSRRARGRRRVCSTSM